FAKFLCGCRMHIQPNKESLALVLTHMNDIVPFSSCQEIFFMRILISNDDGIYSPGINTLATIASKFGEVIVVAPDVEQSSMGHAVTHSRPLSYKKSPIEFEEGIEAYRV